MPTTEEINQSSEKNNSEIKKDLEESIQKAKQLQKDVNELAKKIFWSSKILDSYNVIQKTKV